MPRVYRTKGELKRSEPITALFTKDQKRRLIEAAIASNLPPGVLVYQIVIARLETPP